jgi:hypothetical protein
MPLLRSWPINHLPCALGNAPPGFNYSASIPRRPVSPLLGSSLSPCGCCKSSCADFGFGGLAESRTSVINVKYLRLLLGLRRARIFLDCLARRRNVGSALPLKEGGEVAKSRLLHIEPWARGLGNGSRLVAECIRFSAGQPPLSDRADLGVATGPAGDRRWRLPRNSLIGRSQFPLALATSSQTTSRGQGVGDWSGWPAVTAATLRLAAPHGRTPWELRGHSGRRPPCPAALRLRRTSSRRHGRSYTAAVFCRPPIKPFSV